MAGNFYRPKKSVQICKLKVFFRTTSAGLGNFIQKSAYFVAQRPYRTRKHMLGNIS